MIKLAPFVDGIPSMKEPDYDWDEEGEYDSITFDRGEVLFSHDWWPEHTLDTSYLEWVERISQQFHHQYALDSLIQEEPTDIPGLPIIEVVQQLPKIILPQTEKEEPDGPGSYCFMLPSDQITFRRR